MGKETYWSFNNFLGNNPLEDLLIWRKTEFPIFKFNDLRIQVEQRGVVINYIKYLI